MVDGAGIDSDKMETNQIEYEGEGFSVTYTVSDKWDGGYTAYIKIVNTGDEVIHNWYLEALGYDSIENIWNAQIVKSSEDTNVYKNMGWNREIAIGGQVEFGFTANKDFEKFPAYFNLVSSIDYIDSKDYSVDYKVDADWGSGFNGTITITNNSDSTIEDWSMIFSYDRTITNIWSATLVPSEDDRYVVRNSGFNADIKPGKSVTFGFSGKVAARKTFRRNLFYPSAHTSKKPQAVFSAMMRRIQTETESLTRWKKIQTEMEFLITLKRIQTETALKIILKRCLAQM